MERRRRYNSRAYGGTFVSTAIMLCVVFLASVIDYSSTFISRGHLGSPAMNRNPIPLTKTSLRNGMSSSIPFRRSMTASANQEQHQDYNTRRLEAKIKAIEAEKEVLVRSTQRAQQIGQLADAGPLQLASLIATPISIAVGVRGYLESTKARRELAEKKRELRQQAAEYSLKLAEQRREFQNQKPQLKIPSVSVSSIDKTLLEPDIPLPPLARRGILAAAAAGLFTGGAKLGQIFADGKPEELAKFREKASQAEKRVIETNNRLNEAKQELESYQRRLEVESNQAREELSQYKRRLKDESDTQKSLLEDFNQKSLTSAKEIERLQEQYDAVQREKDSVLQENKMMVAQSQQLSSSSSSSDRSISDRDVSSNGLSFEDGKVKTLLAGSTGLAAAFGILGFNTKKEATKEREMLESRYETDIGKAKTQLEKERQEAARKLTEQDDIAKGLQQEVKTAEKRAEQLQDTINVQQNRAKELQRTIDLLRDSEKRNKESINMLETARNEAEAKGVELRQEIVALNSALEEAQSAIKSGNEAAAEAATKAANSIKNLETDVLALKKEVKDLTETNTASAQEIEAKKTELSQKEKELSSLRNDMSQAKAAADKAIADEKARVAELTEQGKKLQSGLEQWQKEYEALKKSSEETSKTLESKVAQLEAQIDTLNGELGSTRTSLASTVKALEETQMSLATSQAKLGETESQLTSRDSELAAAKKDLVSVKTELEGTETVLAEERSAVAKLSQEIENVRLSLEKSSRQNTELTTKYEGQVKSLNDVIAKNKKSLDTMQKDLQEQQASSKMESDALRSSVSLLEKERKQLAGETEKLSQERTNLQNEIIALKKQSELDVKRVQGAYDDLTRDLEVAEESENRLRGATARLTELQSALDSQRSESEAMKASDARKLQESISQLQEEHASDIDKLRAAMAMEHERQLSVLREALVDERDAMVADAAEKHRLRTSAYEVALTEARDHLKKMEEKYQEQVKELVARIEELGATVPLSSSLTTTAAAAAAASKATPPATAPKPKRAPAAEKAATKAAKTSDAPKVGDQSGKKPAVAAAAKSTTDTSSKSPAAEKPVLKKPPARPKKM